MLDFYGSFFAKTVEYVFFEKADVRKGADISKVMSR